MTELSKALQYDAADKVPTDVTNRGEDIKLTSADKSPISITLMNIDETIVNYFNTTIAPSIDDNGTAKKVPTVYGTPERWATFRKEGVLRDSIDGKMLTPMIMLKRTSIERGQLSNPSNKYVETAYEPGWNARNAYDRFSVLNGIKPSREFYTIVIPDYIIITYDVVLWTEYESQMSDLIGQIQVEGDEYWGTRDDYKFRVKIDAFNMQSDLDSSKDRVVRTGFEMKVNAYLLPEKMLKKFHITPTTKKIYTDKKTIIIEETVGDINNIP